MSTFKRNDQDRYQHLNEMSISTSKRRLLLSTSQTVSIVQIYGMLSVTEDSNRFLFQIVTSSQILVDIDSRQVAPQIPLIGTGHQQVVSEIPLVGMGHQQVASQVPFVGMDHRLMASEIPLLGVGHQQLAPQIALLGTGHQQVASEIPLVGMSH
ncbi:unnamed protein product [Adineta steineri]|uniref:Uncharacterized protein n=1 Tax=Adineta steineri TaxID=433720 RepID=A0A816DE72_9BILA|nr:unnamed protein product [Adineta steineri]CAF1468922.1 unnamed protein product [Adineta steineri]CAF1601381.1 unnamed protein product [Adineta steineri]CAF1635182.1 unnamed protein product [Adineta steineri]